MNDLIITLGVTLDEIISFNIIKYIEIIITFLIVTYISKKAEKTIYRLILSLLGIHFFSSHIGHGHFLFAFDVSVGLSLLIPHIVYWIDYIKRFIQRTIEISTNFFFFILTIYYKLRKFVLWFYEIYLKIINFFAKQKYDKTKKEYESKQDKKQKAKNEYYEKQEYSSNYKSDEKTNDRNSDYSYKEEQKQSSSSNNNYESSSSQNTSNNNPYGKEFNQFFSSNYYIRLGVTTSDDKATIKKAYRKLVMKYHPDVNFNDEYEKYNHICQLINEANEVLMK